MITDLLLQAVITVIHGLDAIFPTFSLPSYFSGGAIIPSSVTSFLAAGFYTVSPFFPSALVLALLVAIANLWPVVLAWIIANWVYNHLPTIAGFGVTT